MSTLAYADVHASKRTQNQFKKKVNSHNTIANLTYMISNILQILEVFRENTTISNSQTT